MQRDYSAWHSRGFGDRMNERLLKQVLHNEADSTILITISDSVKSETLKKIYTLLLDEEIKQPEDIKEAPSGRR